MIHRGRLTTYTSVRKAPKAGPWQTPSYRDEDDWNYRHYNGLDSLARELYEDNIPDQIDTGLLDKNGNHLVRNIYRNPIGFRANLDDDEE